MSSPVEESSAPPNEGAESMEVSSGAAAAPEIVKKERESLSRKEVLPDNSVKRIMKLNKGVRFVNPEGLAAMRKSTELFLEMLAEESFKVLQTTKRKTINMEDINAALENNDNLEFLKDAFGPSLDDDDYEEIAPKKTSSPPKGGVTMSEA